MSPHWAVGPKHLRDIVRQRGHQCLPRLPCRDPKGRRSNAGDPGAKLGRFFEFKTASIVFALDRNIAHGPFNLLTQHGNTSFSVLLEILSK